MTAFEAGSEPASQRVGHNAGVVTILAGGQPLALPAQIAARPTATERCWISNTIVPQKWRMSYQCVFQVTKISCETHSGRFIDSGPFRSVRPK